jgi:hypothetical protein
LSKGFGGSGAAVILIDPAGGIAECVDLGKLLGEFGLNTLKFLAGLRLISSLGGTITTAVPFIAPGGAVCDCCC